MSRGQEPAKEADDKTRAELVAQCLEEHRGESQSIPMGDLEARVREMKARGSVSGSGEGKTPSSGGKEELEKQQPTKCCLYSSGEKNGLIFLNFLQLKVEPGRILEKSSHFA